MKKSVRWIPVGTALGAAALLTAAIVTAAALPAETQPQASAASAAVGTSFSYQGQLKDGTHLVNGSCDMAFRLYDDATVGDQVGSAITTTVPITGGLFTVSLDFGEVFTGTARWLGIAVQCPDDAGFTTFSPRQALTPAPYALALPGLWTQQNGTSPNLIGGYSGNSVPPGVYGATIGGGGSSGAINQVTGIHGTVGGGKGNAAGDWYTTVGGGEGNTADGTVAWYATVGGGHNNSASYAHATVGGGEGNTASNQWATVGGGYYNTASGSPSTVGGGQQNEASGSLSTIGGGRENVTTEWAATVSGGQNNQATGWYATVGGGSDNTASHYFATVAGGYHNTAGGGYGATVSGGQGNTASGDYCTVGGGYQNTASGDYSLAAGESAQATHPGSFVWSSGGTTTSSWYTSTFTARSEGGVRFYTASGITAGVELAAGGGSWASLSDRNAKENFADVDAGQVLDTLAAMPIRSWNLKSQSPEIRHIGPVAQDFNVQFAYLFGEVESPVHINTMDGVGVALAATQGLYELSQEQAAQIEALTAERAALQRQYTALEAENTVQQEQIDDLTQRLEAVEQSASPSSQAGPGDTPAGWMGVGMVLAVGGIVCVVRRRDGVSGQEGEGR
jgi:hypothetical protein